MDIGELLSYKVNIIEENCILSQFLVQNVSLLLLYNQPEQTPKRPNEENYPEEEDEKEDDRRANDRARKKQRTGSSNAAITAKRFLQANGEPEISEEERLNILRYVEQEEAAGETLDENGLRKMILLFEKRNLKNQEMRIKFQDNPEKFMESEIDLSMMINELKVVATVPGKYIEIIKQSNDKFRLK